MMHRRRRNAILEIYQLVLGFFCLFHRGCLRLRTAHFVLIPGFAHLSSQ
jgi:hypothetical protein